MTKFFVWIELGKTRRNEPWVKANEMMIVEKCTKDDSQSSFSRYFTDDKCSGLTIQVLDYIYLVQLLVTCQWNYQQGMDILTFPITTFLKFWTLNFCLFPIRMERIFFYFQIRTLTWRSFSLMWGAQVINLLKCSKFEFQKGALTPRWAWNRN